MTDIQTIAVCLAVVALAAIVRWRTCRHHWEIKRSGDVMGEAKWPPIGHYYELKCSVCGDLKHRRF